MRDRLVQGWSGYGWFNVLMLPVSWVYQVLFWCNRQLYSLGLLATRSVPAPVIVVGGITAGGAGKTPLVIAIADYFKQQGRRPGIVSRGYGGKTGQGAVRVSHLTTARQVGDEPQLIHELTGLPVVVGPDRIESGRYLVQQCQCDLVINDDGFQRFSLARDVDIAVVDGQAGFGNGWCLPAGPLREKPAALKRADLVVVNGAPDDGLALPGNVFEMSMELVDAYNLKSGQRRDIATFEGSPVHAVAGLGNPERFFRQLEQQAIPITRHAFFDHHRFEETDLVFDDSLPVLMTEKDGIKCRNMTAAKLIWVISARASLDPGFFTGLEQLLESRPQ